MKLNRFGEPSKPPGRPKGARNRKPAPFGLRHPRKVRQAMASRREG